MRACIWPRASPSMLDSPAPPRPTLLPGRRGEMLRDLPTKASMNGVGFFLNFSPVIYPMMKSLRDYFFCARRVANCWYTNVSRRDNSQVMWCFVKPGKSGARDWVFIQALSD